jgi:hypothetical protein
MNNKKIKLFCGASLLLATTFQSCKKEENSPPVINITSPASGALIGLSDSVRITGTASDDKELHEMSITLTEMAPDTVVFTAYPYVHEKESFNFSAVYKPKAAGSYLLEVTAEDHDGGQSSKQVLFNVAP